MGEKFSLSKPLKDIEGGGQLIPEGYYAFKIARAKIEKGPSGKLLRCGYVVAKGSLEGAAPFPDQLSLTEQAEWKVKPFLLACGAPLEAKDFNTDNLVGKVIIAATYVDTWEGQKRNKYMSYMKYSDEAIADLQGKPIKGDGAGESGEEASGSGGGGGEANVADNW